MVFLFGLMQVALVADVLADTEKIVIETVEPDALPSYADLLLELTKAKRKQLPAIIEKMIAMDEQRTLPFLQALLEGVLYYRRDDSMLFQVVKNNDGQFDLYKPGQKQLIATVVKSDIKKVKTNNKLRKQLRAYIAQLQLFSNNTEMRLSAVANMMQSISSKDISLLRKAQLSEKNKRVSKKITEALALADLSSGDDNQQLVALQVLDGNLEPVVKNKLLAMVEESSPGVYGEENPDVRLLAAKVLQGIESKISLYAYAERIFFGLSLGSILLLVAAGLAITFGVMGVINMAHGELIMLGAYTTYVIQQIMPNHVALSIFLAIPMAFIVSALFGIAIERGVIQFLKGRPLETLLATFGISLVLQQLVRTIFSPLNRQVVTPEFMSGSLQINAVFSLTYNRIYILIFSLLVFALLLFILKKTPLGLYVRAVSQNRDMARAMGIRSEWVDAMTFGLGSGIAGLAGVALSQITNVGPNLGQAYIIDSFMVVVFGGVGNLWGTLVGAFTLGSLNKFLEPATGAVLANIIVLVGIILFIQKRPRGLFPQKGRAAES